MKLYFEDAKENALFQLSDFTCPQENIRMNTSNLYRVIWVLEDEVEFRVDTIPLLVKKNQLVFFTPHNQVEFLSSAFKLISISFNREFYCIQTHDKDVSCHGYLFYGSSEVPIIDLNENEVRSFDLLFQVLKEEFTFRDKVQGEMLRVLLKRWLIKSARLSRELLLNPDIQDTQLDIVRQFNVLVEMHFREKHQVQDYADLLFKSPKTLSNVFKQYNDRSPLQIINERLTLEARRLLDSTDLNVEEIAQELGYSDGPHFSKFFKKQVGISPIAFKKSLVEA